MGLFGHSCRWKNYGRKVKRDGKTMRQQRCTRCGKLRWVKVRQRRCFLGFCQWKLDRRMRPPGFRCKRCGTTRRAVVRKNS